ncbi:MAG: 50S ribosomal protein L24 [Candidatus Nomurabacteria bacterium]|jgi:large subunit ribosomal protein L24|nr:50S ribosomal protein L24 [Candidatus Nomurabacteria bacterium]
MLRIKKDDVVKITTGGNKGKIGKVVRVTDNKVWVEGVNIKERHIRPSKVNPRGGKKDVHLPVDISNVAIIHDGKEATSRVAYKITDAGKQRIAKKTGKEIK